MSTTKELVEHSFDVYNSRDIDAFIDLYADDAVLSFPQGAIQGRDAIRQNWAEQWTSVPDSHITSELLVAEGDTVAAEFTYTGTSTGPITMADGTTVPATGRHLEMKGMQLLRLRDGKVVRHDIFLDSGEMAAQMGWQQSPFSSAAS